MPNQQTAGTVAPRLARLVDHQGFLVKGDVAVLTDTHHEGLPLCRFDDVHLVVVAALHLLSPDRLRSGSSCDKVNDDLLGRAIGGVALAKRVCADRAASFVTVRVIATSAASVVARDAPGNYTALP